MMIFSDRQREIVEHAAGLIMDLGIQGLTMKNLAGRVGISEPALYRHFENKHEIILGILKTFQSEMMDSLAPVLEENQPALDACASLLRVQLGLLSDHPAFAAIIFSEEIFHNDDVLRHQALAMMDIYHEMIVQLLERAMREGTVRSDLASEQLALVVIGSIRLLVARWRIEDFSFELNARGNSLISTLKLLLMTSDRDAERPVA